MNTESSTPFQNTEISTAQKNMWLLNALDKNNTSYVITLAFDLLGSLNPLALEKSIQALLDRHPILKSYYPSRQGVPIKVMEQNLKVDLDRIDISDGQFSEHELLNYVNQLSNSVFDISKPPLIRFSLLKLSPQRHVFIVSMHHIISDG